MTPPRFPKGRPGRLLAALFLATAPASPGVAAPAPAPPAPAALATWQRRGDGAHLVISLSEALSDKQKSIIEGGFTTVSQLTLRPLADEGGGSPVPLVDVRCSVKFDAWEETFEVVRLLDQTVHIESKPFFVKTMAEYGDLCLRAELDENGASSPLKAGGVIVAHLVVKQTSEAEARRIKEWLVQQQSGVMQSLFSHMLGELTLQQAVTVQVNVPPLPTLAKPVPTPGPRSPHPKRR